MERRARIPRSRGQPGALTLTEDDRRVLAVWAADVAERTIALFEAAAPTDRRPREAIEGLRAFARGEIRIGPVRAVAAAAHAAAREVADPAAIAAARAAGHASATAHMAAHARGASAYAALAAGFAAGDDAGDRARLRELRWHVDHASPAVREILGRLPPPHRVDGVLGPLIRDLDEAVTGTDRAVAPRAARSCPRRQKAAEQR